MPHQSHNISYSKYLEFLKIFKNPEITTKEKHRIVSKNKTDILAYEFIQVLKEFSQTIKLKIKEAKPYTDVEYNRQSKFTEKIEGTEFYFEHLCNAITSGDVRLFSTILKHMNATDDNMSRYNYGFPYHGQAYLGGLCQVFHSFLHTYLLINTLIYAGYEYHKFFSFFEDEDRASQVFSNAFRFGCNAINDDFQTTHKDIIQKASDRKYRADVSCSDLRVLSKEMFRLMYTTYAILTIYDDDNDIDINDTIGKLINELFY